MSSIKAKYVEILDDGSTVDDSMYSRRGDAIELDDPTVEEMGLEENFSIEVTENWET
jgi:hypothetical protein